MKAPVVLALALLAIGARGEGADRFAVIVSGASGGPQFAQRYDSWRDQLLSILRDQFGYPAEHIQVLSDSPSPGTGARHAKTSGLRSRPFAS